MSNNEKIFPEKICLIPFVGLNVHPTGEYQLCSSSREKFDLKPKDSLSSIWKSQAFSLARNKMLNNQEVNPNCSGCYQLEKLGVESKRQKFNRKRLKFYGHNVCHDLLFNEEQKILELDISFSNNCNLNCIMCNSEYSSSWFKLDQKAVSQGLIFRKPTNIHSWSLSKNIIDSIVDIHAKDLRSILIKGGEPLIDNRCLYFLKKLADCKKRNPFLTVYIQTNGTVINPKIIEAIGNLDIEISFSIDGLHDHYKYIRGFDFNKVMGNFEKLIQIKSLKHTYFHYTASAFNFHRIFEFIEFIEKKRQRFIKLKKLSFGVAHAKYLNFRVFHQSARHQIIEKIEKTVKKLNIQEDFFDGYDNILLKELSLSKLGIDAVNQFKSWLSFCNNMRNIKLQDIDGDFNQLLQRAL